MPPDYFPQLPDGFLLEPTTGFIRERLGSKTKLKHNPLGPPFELRKKGFVNVAGIEVAFSWAGLRTTCKGCFHLSIAHQPVIDVCGQMGGGGKDLIIRDRVYVMSNGLMHVLQ